jgi:hypothetical protein
MSISNKNTIINSPCETQPTTGYIYCLSNPSMPGLLNIGMTNIAPAERALELFTTGVPTRFKIEFAKNVNNPRKKETTLNTLLSRYTERVSPYSQFFRCTPEQAYQFVDLIDGDFLLENADVTNIGTSRDMTKYFTDEQRILHKIHRTDNTWIGTYDYSTDKIMYNSTPYTSLDHFLTEHHKIDGTAYNHSQHAWDYCKCEVNGEWISTNRLSPKN